MAPEVHSYRYGFVFFVALVSCSEHINHRQRARFLFLLRISQKKKKSPGIQDWDTRPGLLALPLSAFFSVYNTSTIVQVRAGQSLVAPALEHAVGRPPCRKRYFLEFSYRMHATIGLVSKISESSH